MKALTLLLGGVLASLSLLGCAENNTDANKATVNVPVAAPSHSQATPSPSELQRENGDDTLSFHFGKQEVQLNTESRIVSEELNEEDSQLKFRISIYYPQIEGPIRPAHRKFNRVLTSLARKTFWDFKSMQLRPRSQRFPRLHEDVFEYLHIRYDIPFATEKLVNVRFNAYTYGRGAAHSVQYFFVFNYDLETGREIKLGDLFQPKSRYLGFISGYARETVKKRICAQGGWAGTQELSDCLKNAPLWEDGIKPIARNFGAWSITREGLLFSFDACQLTGCSSGEFYVSVPYSQLKNLIKRNGVISPFLEPAA